MIRLELEGHRRTSELVLQPLVMLHNVSILWATYPVVSPQAAIRAHDLDA